MFSNAFSFTMIHTFCRLCMYMIIDWLCECIVSLLPFYESTFRRHFVLVFTDTQRVSYPPSWTCRLRSLLHSYAIIVKAA